MTDATGTSSPSAPSAAPGGAAPIHGDLFGAALVFRHTLWQMGGGRKLLLMIIGLVAPMGLAFVIPQSADPDRLFGMLGTLLFMQFLAPLIGIAFAVGLISDEADRGTLLYLIIRPIRKQAIVIGKMLS